MACIALAEWRPNDKVIAGDETVKLLISKSDVSSNEPEAAKILRDMLDKGHRYKNLERHVGGGIAFALGVEMAETQCVAGNS